MNKKNVFFSLDGTTAIAIGMVAKLHLRHWVPKNIGYAWNKELEHWDVVATYAVGNETHNEIVATSTNEADARIKYMALVDEMSAYKGER